MLSRARAVCLLDKRAARVLAAVQANIGALELTAPSGSLVAFSYRMILMAFSYRMILMAFSYRMILMAFFLSDDFDGVFLIGRF